GDELNEDERELLKAARYFDPTTAAALFADRAILIEGHAEKVSLPAILETMEIEAHGLEVVSCSGGSDMPTYQKVLEGLRQPYVLWFDKDQGDKVKQARKAKTDIGAV